MSNSHTNDQSANKSTETFWPLLRSALMSREVTFSDLELQCPICYTNMSIPADPASEENSDSNHGPVVYPCGHMLGRSCFVENVQYNTDNGRDVSCPVCRGKFNYTKCKHPHYGLKMPHDMKGVEDFPTIVPRGGVVFELCHQCLIEATLKTAGEKLRADPDLPEDLRHRATVSITVNGQTYYSQDARGELVDFEAPVGFRGYVAGLKAGLAFYEDSEILWMSGKRLRDMEIKCHSCPNLQLEGHECFCTFCSGHYANERQYCLAVFMTCGRPRLDVKAWKAAEYFFDTYMYIILLIIFIKLAS